MILIRFGFAAYFFDFLRQTTKSPSEVGSTDATLAGAGQGHEFDSCIQLLNGRMQVQWEAILEGVIIRLSARMDENEYMSFGISGAEGKTQMIGADVAVAYYNSDDNKFYAGDYILNAKAQVISQIVKMIQNSKVEIENSLSGRKCDGSNGACPDNRIGGRNDVSMLYGQRVNGVTTVAYQRSLDAQETKFDQVIPPVGRVNVIAAIGPLNSRKEANYHSTDRTGSQGNINHIITRALTLDSMATMYIITYYISSFSVWYNHYRGSPH